MDKGIRKNLVKKHMDRLQKPKTHRNKKMYQRYQPKEEENVDNRDMYEWNYEGEIEEFTDQEEDTLDYD